MAELILSSFATSSILATVHRNPFTCLNNQRLNCVTPLLPRGTVACTETPNSRLLQCYISINMNVVHDHVLLSLVKINFYQIQKVGYWMV